MKRRAERKLCCVPRPSNQHRDLAGPCITYAGWIGWSDPDPVTIAGKAHGDVTLRGIATTHSASASGAQSKSANACFIARAVAATASSAGRVRIVALNGSARTGPS
jgi:hypothetical protein